MEISQYINMDRVWDTCKYYPKLSVSIFKVKILEGCGGKERSNCKFYVCAQFFTKNATNGPRTHFERSKSGKIENRENAEIPDNSVKMAVFDL